MTPATGTPAMFDPIAGRYDLVNRIISFGLDPGWRRRAAKSLLLEPGQQVLDLATGTGDFAIALARGAAGTSVVAVDGSRAMLRRAESKVRRMKLDYRIRLLEGDVTRLEFSDSSFDRVTMAFGIRNLPDPTALLRKIARIVKPGGLVGILELTEPDRGLIAPFLRLHIHTFVPMFGSMVSCGDEYRHLARSIAAFPSPAAFEAMMKRTGFVVLPSIRMTFGSCVLFRGIRPLEEVNE